MAINNNRGSVQNNSERLTSGDEASGQLTGPQTMQQAAPTEGYKRLLAGSLGSTARETNFIKTPLEALETPGGTRMVYNSDPLQMYYYSRDLNPLADFGVNSERQINQNKHLSFGNVRSNNFPEDLNTRGETVNWSYGGYTSSEGIPRVRSLHEIDFMHGDIHVPLHDILTSAFEGDDAFSSIQVDNFQANNYRLVHPNGYNMAEQLCNFMTQTIAKRLPQNEEEQILRSILFRTQNVQYQIMAATGLTVDQFINNRAVELNRRGTPQFPLTNAYEVQEYFKETGVPASSLRAAAMAAYPPDVYKRLVEEKYVDMEYCDFSMGLPYTKDIYSSKNNLFSGQSSNTSMAEIQGEYNFYLKAYQEGSLDPNIPEAVLPNFYIYNILSQGQGNIDTSPEWQGSAEAASELQNNYDSYVRLGEFTSGILPRASDPGFIDYLEGYGNAVSQGVEVDVIDRILSGLGDLMVPTSDIDLFDKIINKKRKLFPMSIDIKIPTMEVKDVGGYINQYNISSRIAKSIKGMNNPTHVPYDVSTSGFQVENRLLMDDLANDEAGIEDLLDPFLLDNPANQPRFKSGITSKMSLKTYGLDEFVDNLASNIQSLTTLTIRGQEGTRDDCLDHFKRMVISQLRSTINANSENKKISYAEMLQGKNFCESETLMFKLTKKKASGTSLSGPGAGSSSDNLQEYYFSNTDLVKAIEFIDTQVKYNTPYYYELTAFAVVYGSKFRFRTKDYSAPVQLSSDENGTTSYQFTGDSDVMNPFYFSFHVETIANPKIIEYPVLSRNFTKDQVVEGLVGGLSYPIVRCVDLPPVPPLVFPKPYKNNYSQMLFLFQTQNASFINENALRYIPFSVSEQLAYDDISRQQKIEKYFDLKKGFCSFQSEGRAEIESIFVYRTDAIDQQIADPSMIYIKNFSDDTLIKRLTVSCDEDVPLADRAESFDFIDSLEPNKKYYYTFRSQDVNGQISVPTPIYEVELYFEKGLYVPYISLYIPKPISKKKSSKRFARFVEIKGSDIQISPYTSYTDHGDILASVKSLVGRGSTHVDFNNFLIRITSKDTGRKLDIKMSFSSREGVDPVIQECDDLLDSQDN